MTFVTQGGNVHGPIVTPSHGAALTGNPYLDPPINPDAWNDEFLAGSPDLAIRGWTVYNFEDNTVMTRVGDVDGSPSAALSVDNYRSTLFESVLMLQIPAAKAVTIIKPSSGSYLYAARVSAPLASPPAGWGGLFLTTAAAPPYITASHNSGAGPGWQLVYVDDPPSVRYLGRQIDAAAFVDIDITVGVDFLVTVDTFLCNHDEATPEQYGTHICAPTAQVRATSVGGTNGELIMATPHANAGVAFASLITSSSAGGASIMTIDYIRRMPVSSWPGLS